MSAAGGFHANEARLQLCEERQNLRASQGEVEDNSVIFGNMNEHNFERPRFQKFEAIRKIMLSW